MSTVVVSSAQEILLLFHVNVWFKHSTGFLCDFEALISHVNVFVCFWCHCNLLK